MKQQLTFNEIEQIGRKCRRHHSDGAIEIGELSFKEIELIERKCRQQRSEAIADMFSALFKTVRGGVRALASTVNTSGQGNKALGASAR